MQYIHINYFFFLNLFHVKLLNFFCIVLLITINHKRIFFLFYYIISFYNININYIRIINHFRKDTYNVMSKTTIKTPQLSHRQSCDWDFVYEPAEDSFLLLDALEKDLDFLCISKPGIILEVGSGSGIIIAALSNVLKNSSHCIAIDINLHACRLTKSTSANSKTSVDVIQGDLTSCLRELVVDVILFNPPYVVTPSEEVNSSDLLTRSWAGGADGVEVINRFLDTFSNNMGLKSFGYIVLLKENKPDEIMAKLKQKFFECEILSKRKVRGEELFVVKFVKMS